MTVSNMSCLPPGLIPDAEGIYFPGMGLPPGPGPMPQKEMRLPLVIRNQEIVKIDFGRDRSPRSVELP
jgi:hypothetical protein